MLLTLLASHDPGLNRGTAPAEEVLRVRWGGGQGRAVGLQGLCECLTSAGAA